MRREVAAYVVCPRQNRLHDLKPLRMQPPIKPPVRAIDVRGVLLAAVAEEPLPLRFRHRPPPRVEADRAEHAVGLPLHRIERRLRGLAAAEPAARPEAPANAATNQTARSGNRRARRTPCRRRRRTAATALSSSPTPTG